MIFQRDVCNLPKGKEKFDFFKRIVLASRRNQKIKMTLHRCILFFELFLKIRFLYLSSNNISWLKLAEQKFRVGLKCLNPK